jgi:hypothetical protein
MLSHFMNSWPKFPFSIHLHLSLTSHSNRGQLGQRVSGTGPYLGHPCPPLDELLTIDMQPLKDQAYQSINIKLERMIDTKEPEEWSQVQGLEPGGRVRRRPLAEFIDRV